MDEQRDAATAKGSDYTKKKLACEMDNGMNAYHEPSK